jgi:hypothetical protein
VSDRILDADSAVVLAEILSEPALPVGTTIDGSEGARGAALREAVDHLTTVRTADVRGRSNDEVDALLDDLAAIDAELADAFRWHVALVAVLDAQQPSRGRNALLGDVARGEVLTLSTDVRRWNWRDGRAPDSNDPIRTADAEILVDEFPGLYDYVLAYADGVLVAVPTHRNRVTWSPEEREPGSWTVHLDRVTFHRDDTVVIDVHPRASAAWREPRHTTRT